jgi:2-enoate reductase
MLGGKWLYQNKKKFEELSDFMDEIHATGAKLFVQMTAGFGRSFALTAPMALLVKNKALGAVARPYLDAEYLTAAP